MGENGFPFQIPSTAHPPSRIGGAALRVPPKRTLRSVQVPPAVYGQLTPRADSAIWDCACRRIAPSALVVIRAGSTCSSSTPRTRSILGYPARCGRRAGGHARRVAVYAATRAVALCHVLQEYQNGLTHIPSRSRFRSDPMAAAPIPYYATVIANKGGRLLRPVGAFRSHASAQRRTGACAQATSASPCSIFSVAQAHDASGNGRAPPSSFVAITALKYLLARERTPRRRWRQNRPGGAARRTLPPRRAPSSRGAGSRSAIGRAYHRALPSDHRGAGA